MELHEATVGRYFYVQNRVMLNYTSKKSGAKYVLAGNEKSYGIMELKKNDRISVTQLSSALLDFADPIKALESLAGIAKNYGILKSLKITDAPEFLKLCMSIGFHNISKFFETFAELQSIREEQCEYIGKFCLIRGDANDKQFEIAKALLKQTEALLNKHGYSGLGYGQMVLTKRIKSGQLASYNPADDNVNLWSGHLKKDSDALRSIIHELGHRLWYKGAVEKQPVFQIYAEVTQVSSADAWRIGDEIQNKTNPDKIFTIDEIGYGRDLKYLVKKKGDTENKRYEIKRSNKGYYVKLNSDQPKSLFDVSGYAHTSVEEFFAEIFSFALTRDIPEILDF